MNENNFVFTERDKTAVIHYIIYGNTSQAYKNAMHGQYKGKSNNLYNIANRYFNSEKIKVLLSVEKQRFIDNADSILERVGVKKDTSGFDNNNDKHNDKNPDISDELNKDQAKKVLIKLINTNKTDAKTVKDAMQLLSKLEQWEKEKPTDNSNIYMYELPKKTIT